MEILAMSIEGSLPWRFKTLLILAVGVLRWVTWVMFDAVHCRASVGKGDLGEKRNGLEMSQK